MECGNQIMFDWQSINSADSPGSKREACLADFGISVLLPSKQQKEASKPSCTLRCICHPVIDYLVIQCHHLTWHPHFVCESNQPELYQPTGNLL